MNHKKFLQLAIVCCLTPLTACGNSSNTSTSTSSEISPSTTEVEITNTTLGGKESITIEAAANQYSLVTRKTSCAVTDYLALEAKYSIGNAQIDVDALPELTDAMSQLAAQRDIAVRALISNDWPQKVKSEIDALALFWASVQRTEVAVSQSTDIGSWNTNIQSYLAKATSSDSGLSKIIRIKLNLPDFSSSEC